MSVSAVLKAFPVAYEYVTGGYNPYKYDYVRIQSGEHKNELYGWMNNTFVCIGSALPISDNNHTHNKSQIVDFAHNHDSTYYVKATIDSMLYLKADKDVKIGSTQPTDNNLWFKEI